MDAVLLESLGVAAVTVAACVARGTASVWPALLRRAGNDYLQQHGQSCVGRSTRSESAAPVQWVVSVAVGVRWVVSVEVGDAQASCRCTNGPTKGEQWFTMHSRAIVPPLRPAARARLPTAGATCNGTRGPSAARRRRRLHSCQRNGRCRAPNRAPASASLSVLGNASTAAAASAQLVAHWRGLRELGYRSRLVVRARRYRLGAQQHAASSPTRVRCGRGRHTATVGPAPTSRRELASQRAS